MSTGFTTPITRMSLTGSPSIPFTEFSVDWNFHPPYAGKPYDSLLDTAVRQGRDMARDALEVLMEGGATRIRLGQNPQAKLVSGLSASGIRVPEIRTGSLVAVSL